MQELTTTRKDVVQAFFMKSENTDKLLAYFDGDRNKADKFKQTIMLIAMSDSLKNCSVESVFKCGIHCAEVGLNPTPSLGQAYFVIYKGKLCFQIGYKGWIYLMEVSGKIVWAEPIYDCDRFTFEIDATGNNMRIVPDLEQRQEHNHQWVEKNLKGVAVFIRDVAKNFTLTKYVQKGKLDQMKLLSPSKSSDYSPWKNFLIEMYMAKAFRYVIPKTTSIDQKTARAIELENIIDIMHKAGLESKILSPLEAKLSGKQYTALPVADISQENPYLVENEDQTIDVEHEDVGGSSE